MTRLLSGAEAHAEALGNCRRIGIVGGTFDPVHRGHLALGYAAADRLGLDAVLYIPTGIPSFKRDRYVVEGRHRVAMVCLALEEAGQAGYVSDCETGRAGITYTYDTAAWLKGLCSPDARLYLVLGTDSYAQVGSWHRSGDLARLVTFAVAGRPGTPLAGTCGGAGDAYDTVYIDAPMPDVSSTAIRRMVREGVSVDGLVGSCVAGYIRDNALYGCGGDPDGQGGALQEGTCAGREGAADEYAWTGGKPATFDPEQEAELGRLHDAVCMRLSGHRLEHVLSVAQTAERLAVRYGVDPFLAKSAGYLHDWDKKLDGAQLWQKVRDAGMDLPVGDDRLLPLLHAWTAAATLPAEFPELPGEVFTAIGRHTVGAPDMTPLDMVLYVADATEPGRRYAGVERLRTFAEGPLGGLYRACVADSIHGLLDRGRYIHPSALDAWNACLENQA